MFKAIEFMGVSIPAQSQRWFQAAWWKRALQFAPLIPEKKKEASSDHKLVHADDYVEIYLNSEEEGCKGYSNGHNQHTPF